MSWYQRRTSIGVPLRMLADWHTRPGALERLTPPWVQARVVHRTGGVTDGGEVTLRLRLGPLSVDWVARHTDYAPYHHFVDEQVRGPFAAWRHTHRFMPTADGHSVLADEIDYRLPLHPLGAAVAGGAVHRALERTFRFRHQRTADDTVRHQRYARYGPLRIAVTGASGLIGRHLVAFLHGGGHRVYRLVRRTPRAERDEIGWNPARGEIDAAALEGLDAVVHLAGESIAAGRWSTARKQRIRDSREQSTRLLSQALAGLHQPPSVLVSMSGVHYYGDSGEAVVTEESPSGDGFLAEVCRAWEAAAEPARAAGIRVVHPRLGMVLSGAGGALAPMLLPFMFGLGGPVGHGRQYMAWVALDDVLGAIQHALYDPALQGPVNLVAPQAVTNRDFARTLGRVLRRPAVLPLPAVAVRLALGQMGRELLLAGQHVRPARLEAAGVPFRYSGLEQALRHELGRFTPEEAPAAAPTTTPEAP